MQLTPTELLQAKRAILRNVQHTVTPQQTERERGLPSGIYADTRPDRRKTYRVKIKRNGKFRDGGSWKTVDEAVSALVKLKAAHV